MLKYENTDPKKKITLAAIWFAAFIFFILLVIHISPISSFISKILEITAPIIIGGAIAYLLNPILKFLEFVVFKKMRSKKAARALSLILTYVYAIFLITTVISVIVPQLTNSILDIGKNYDVYIDSVLAIVNNIISKFSTSFENFDAAQAKDIVVEIFNESEDIVQSVTERILAYGKNLIVTLKNIFIGLFISIYILVSKERLYAQSIKSARAFMSDKLFNNCMKYIKISNSTFGRFFIGKLVDSTIIFALSVIILAIMNIPHTILIAMTVSILNIIPFFGIIIGIIISAFIVLIAAPEKFVIYIIVMIIIQQLDSNVIAPKILGSSAGISSLGVIIAVTIMGSYFGIVGMIIGVPIFAIIISITKEWLEKRLKNKELPTSTTEYYDDTDYSIESEEHKPVTRLLLDPLLSVISKGINSVITHSLKKDDATEKDDDQSPPTSND